MSETVKEEKKVASEPPALAPASPEKPAEKGKAGSPKEGSPAEEERKATLLKVKKARMQYVKISYILLK